MEFYQILILIIVGAVAIKISFKFDLNRYLDDRRKIKIGQLQNICPHCKIEVLDKNNIKVESYFHTPSGNPNWICRRCRCVVPFEEDVNKISQNYAKDPKKWFDNEIRFIKQMKKLKLA